MNKEKVKNMTEEELRDWLANINNQSSEYSTMVGLELSRRHRQAEDQVASNLIKSINNLRETWGEKLIWLFITATVVGLVVNVLSAVILRWTGIR